MTLVRLGAVGYLNARPLVYGLERRTDFSVRFDVPSRCAELLHAGAIDVGLIPSIEYLRGQRADGGGAGYVIAPDLAIASKGRVASVTLYTARDVRDVRSIALDTSSRTSVALVSVLCARAFHIRPALTPHPPDLAAMLAVADAALVIGDTALFQAAADGLAVTKSGLERAGERFGPGATVQQIDLGEAWTDMTGLPFVYAFWAGREAALNGACVEALQRARDAGVAHVDDIARAYCPDSIDEQEIAARYLRDNIRYRLGADERAGLELFFRYAAEAGVVSSAGALRFSE